MSELPSNEPVEEQKEMAANEEVGDEHLIFIDSIKF
jgi:hypothetical protein